MHELLDTAPVDRLAGVDVPLRVDRIAMQERELAGLVSGLAEIRYDLAGHPIHRMHDFVAAVDLEEVRLRGVVREAQVPRRAGGAKARRAADAERDARARYDGNDALQLAGLGE